MKYLAAYLLCVLGGKATPTADDVTKVLSSVGANVDAARVTLVVKELNGKDINELIAAGKSKIGSVAAAAAPAAAAAAPAAAAPAAKKEVKEEKKEESDDDMGMGLFD
ncbi:hypothetical protein CYY_010039 [Polysphondylium violaceum]|uniref:60S acidic ribosomal protein P2 n=1 Tax=Polysphondylium violaceum TaxID=133409 RepID=A0A8J4PJK6_9MYCE|nr:hypothetical protein CYY_010039 [Polysphondylium violaceum]